MFPPRTLGEAFLIRALIGERHLSRDTQRAIAIRWCNSFVRRTPLSQLAEQLTCEHLLLTWFWSFWEMWRRSALHNSHSQSETGCYSCAGALCRRPESGTRGVVRSIHSVPFKRGDRNPLTYLEKEEMDALLNAPDEKTTFGPRDRALLLFLYDSGARASEAAGVTVEDLEQERAGYRNCEDSWEGRKTRICPLWASDSRRTSTADLAT